MMMSRPFTCIVSSRPLPSFSAAALDPSASRSPKPSLRAIISISAKIASPLPQERSRPSASSLLSIPLSWSSIAQEMHSPVVRMSSPSLLHMSLAFRARQRSPLPTLEVKEPKASYSGPSPYSPAKGPSLTT